MKKKNLFSITKHGRKRMKEREIKINPEIRKKCLELGHQLSGLSVIIKTGTQRLVVDLKDGLPKLVTAWDVKK